MCRQARFVGSSHFAPTLCLGMSRRPGTAVRRSTDPELALDSSSADLRPHSAPANRQSRPKSGKSGGKVDAAAAAEHCAQLRKLAAQAKTAPTDREAMKGLVDAYELMKQQKEEATARAHASSIKLSTLMLENADMHERLQSLTDTVADYQKLDIVAEMIDNDQMVESISEINAAGMGSTKKDLQTSPAVKRALLTNLAMRQPTDTTLRRRT